MQVWGAGRAIASLVGSRLRMVLPKEVIEADARGTGPRKPSKAPQPGFTLASRRFS